MQGQGPEYGHATQANGSLMPQTTQPVAMAQALYMSVVRSHMQHKFLACSLHKTLLCSTHKHQHQLLRKQENNLGQLLCCMCNCMSNSDYSRNSDHMSDKEYMEQYAPTGCRRGFSVQIFIQTSQVLNSANPTHSHGGCCCCLLSCCLG